MSLDYSKLPELWQWVLLIGAVLTALAIIWLFARKAWPTFVAFVKAMSRFVSTMNALADLPQFMVTTAATLAGQDEQIAEIHHEVKFNNGSSVKDAVSRVEKKLVTMRGTQSRIEKGVKGLYTRTDALEERTRPKTPARRSVTK